MSDIDRAVLDCLRDLDTEPDERGVRLRGTMVFPKELEGPPGRVHGGIHPLVRTLPILRRLDPSGLDSSAIRIDATLGKGLPLVTPVTFDGHYARSDSGYALRTRFLDSDRLIASASPPSPTDLPSGDALAAVRELVARSEREEGRVIRVLGTPYRVSASAVVLDLRNREGIAPESHLARCIHDDGAIGLTALCTQLDAVGATGRGVLMQHPHFTSHITLAFDLRRLRPDEPLILVADRTSIVEDASPDAPKVDVRGTAYGAATVEVVAVDGAFTRCFAHGFVTAHPVDKTRYEGFEGMRKLREV